MRARESSGRALTRARTALRINDTGIAQPSLSVLSHGITHRRVQRALIRGSPQIQTLRRVTRPDIDFVLVPNNLRRSDIARSERAPDDDRSPATRVNGFFGRPSETKIGARARMRSAPGLRFEFDLKISTRPSTTRQNRLITFTAPIKSIQSRPTAIRAKST